jgi:hypothetical protein
MEAVLVGVDDYVALLTRPVGNQSLSDSERRSSVGQANLDNRARPFGEHKIAQDIAL